MSCSQEVVLPLIIIIGLPILPFNHDSGLRADEKERSCTDIIWLPGAQIKLGLASTFQCNAETPLTKLLCSAVSLMNLY